MEPEGHTSLSGHPSSTPADSRAAETPAPLESAQSAQRSTVGGDIATLPLEAGGGATIAHQISPKPDWFTGNEWDWFAKELITANLSSKRYWSVVGDDVRENMELRSYLARFSKPERAQKIRQIGEAARVKYGGVVPTVVYGPAPAPTSSPLPPSLPAQAPQQELYSDINTYSTRQKIYGIVEQDTQYHYPNVEIIQSMYSDDSQEDSADLVRYSPEGLPDNGLKYFGTERLELGQSLSLKNWRELVVQGYNHKDDGGVIRLRDIGDQSIWISENRGPIPPEAGLDQVLSDDKIYTTTPLPSNLAFPSSEQQKDLTSQGLQTSDEDRVVRLHDDDQGNARWTSESFITAVVDPPAMHPAYGAMLSQETIDTFKSITVPFDTHPSFPSGSKDQSR